MTYYVVHTYEGSLKSVKKWSNLIHKMKSKMAASRPYWIRGEKCHAQLQTKQLMTV